CCGPCPFQRHKDTLPLLGYPRNFGAGRQSHLENIFFPDLGIVPRIIFEEGFDQYWLKARAFTHFWMSLQIRTGGDAPHHHLNRHHLTSPYQQRRVVDLPDKVCLNLLLIEQAEDISCGDRTPTRSARQLIAS